MNLNQVNHIKNIFEPLFFKKVINRDFDNLVIAQEYLVVLDKFLRDTLHFKGVDIDAVEVYKRRIGWYGRAESDEQISKEFNKEKIRIQVLYDRSVKKLSHPLILAKLVKMLVNYLYIKHENLFDERRVNWHTLEKITINYNEFLEDERKYINTRIGKL